MALPAAPDRRPSAPPWLPDPELVTSGQIAERIGRSVAWRTNLLKHRSRFPAPVATGAVTVYAWATVVRWLYANRPDLYDNARRWHAGLEPVSKLTGRPASGVTTIPGRAAERIGAAAG